jgi:putative transcriptional regulator
MTAPGPGILLISDPFLKDPNFLRSVVFICEHREEGSFGFVINKSVEPQLGDLIEGAEGIRFPVYEGGPVQKDTLHFIHQRPDLIPGGAEVVEGIFWGGDFEEVLSLLRADRIGPQEIRFFLGYSGWSEGQLEEELQEKSWITSKASPALVFNSEPDATWRNALDELGGEYRQMTNYPIDPQLN